MLKILLVEDSAVDAELIELQLRAERLAVQIKRVQTRGEFVGALDTGAWDVVLADFSLPQFGALEVMEIFRRRGSESRRSKSGFSPSTSPHPPRLGLGR